MGKLRQILTIALVGAMVFGLASSPAVAKPVAKVQVLIGFDQPPGPNEKAIVHRAGGTIKYTYHIIPVIAATVPETAIAGLRANPRVTHVDFDGKVYAIEETLPWGVDRIDAEFVHAAGNKGTGVKVAIIDTGIDKDHPDLQPNIKGGVNFVAKPWWANPDPEAWDDDNGHGSHVAGTVAAVDNEIGVIGVAPEAWLYGVKVLDRTGSGYWSDVIAGIDWSVSNGMQVINMSLGASSAPDDVRRACDEAYAAGIVIVAAAGNNGDTDPDDDVIYPAKYASVIAVAATDDTDSRASWSSDGPEVELAAPGVSIPSTWKNGDYKTASGTSMASPHVAGTAALVIVSGVVSDTDGFYGIANEVRDLMNATADDLGDPGRDNLYGYGVVDAEEAVLGTQSGNDLASEAITDIAITAVDAPSSVVQGDIVDISVTVENVGNQDVTSDITVTLNDDTDAVTIGIQTISEGLAAGASTTLTFSWDTGSASVGDHTLTASHDFSDDDSSNDSKSTTVSIVEEAAVTVMSIDPNTMKAGTTVEVTITGSGFVDGANVTLENGKGPAPAASNIVVVDANTITATITAKSGGPPQERIWDVRVTNPDGSSGVLVDGFTVTP